MLNVRCNALASLPPSLWCLGGLVELHASSNLISELDGPLTGMTSLQVRCLVGEQ